MPVTIKKVKLTEGPSLQDALDFLGAAFPDVQEHTFLTLDDVELDSHLVGGKSKKKRKLPDLTREIHGSVQDQWGTICDLSKQGAGVFYTVNETDLKGRKKDNITRVRAVWQEDDDGWDGMLPLEPHVVIETSPGRYHRLWLVDGVTVDDFEQVMETMVVAYGSDPNAKDLARVLRLPGTLHQKAVPFRTRVIERNDISLYTREQILEAFPPVPKAPGSFKYPPIAEIGSQLEAVTSALASINDDSWITWITVGKILKDEFGDVGIKRWMEWSKRSSKFHRDECEKTWAGFNLGSSANRATLGTIFWLAQRNGWTFSNVPGKLRSSDTPLVRLESLFESMGTVRLNRFKGTIELKDLPWSKSNHLSDVDIIKAQVWAEKQLGKQFGKGVVQDALTLVADHNSYDPLVEYLEALEWDGTSRLDYWLVRGFGVTENLYSKGVGRMYLISAVARALSPGCKVDTVLVLEGDQGAQKSSALRALVGDELFSDSISPMESKDAVMDLQGKWLIEISDLSSIKRSGIEVIKAFLSRQVDHCRPPYGRMTQDYPRRCVLVGTTNEYEYLKDSTGNRRYWPVSCDKADADWVEQNRDQLWAEAVDAFKAGEKWWPTDPELIELVREEQASREQVDPWREPIAALCEGREIVSVSTLLASLGVNTGQQTKVHQDRVAGCLISMGWQRRRLSLTAKKERPWVYVAPGVTTLSNESKNAFLKWKKPHDQEAALVFCGLEDGQELPGDGVVFDDVL